jgi:hypothetical protein
MISNGTQVGICTETDYYVVESGAITHVASKGFSSAAYQDGYGIFAQNGGSEVFWISNLDDLSVIDALDFSTADAFADSLVGLISDHREVWLFGKNSTEVWYNSGAAGFPFTRAAGGFIERGCASAGSIAKAEHKVFWLGDDWRVYASQGYTPVAISNPAIEKLIEAAGDQDSVNAFTYTQQGHVFYVMNFLTMTIVYDITTGKWHERKSPNKDGWLAQCHAWFAGHNVVGSSADVSDATYTSGSLYRLELDFYYDETQIVRREMTSPTISVYGKRVCMDEFMLDAETGTATADGDGADPNAYLECSDDGGKTWSTPREASMGLIGQYGTRIRWIRLGSFYQRVVRIVITEPIKCAIVGAFARMEVWQ